MRDTLLIRLHAGTDAAEWILVEDSVRIGHAGEGPLEQAAALAANRRVIALAPGVDVLLTRVSLPTRSRQRRLQAVPFALEDRLTDEVEDLHFAIADGAAPGEVAVAVVARARMQQWLERLRGAGLEPNALVPEPLALPWEPDTVTVLLEARQSLVRCGPHDGAAVDTENLGLWLRTWLREHPGAASRVRVFQPADLAAPALALEVEVQIERFTEPPATLLARGLDPNRAIDLLQGPFSRRERSERQWRPWLPAAGLLLGWIASQAAVAALEYRELARTNETLQQRIEQRYRQLFPQDQRIVDVQAQLEGHLKRMRRQAGGGEVGLLALLARAGTVLRNTHGVTLQGMSFQDGKLDLKLTLPDLQTLDQLKQALAEQGLAAEIASAQARDNKVECRMILRQA